MGVNVPVRGYLAIKQLICLTLFILCLSTSMKGQVNWVVIDSIKLDGNKKTKEYAILQEIDLRPGDTLDLTYLAERLSSNEKRLQSTGLFSFAKINMKNWDMDKATCDLIITLKENWYIYPYIILELADRNFNVWSKEHNYDLNRLNYGLALTHANLTGRRDKLKVKWQQGYTKKYELEYTLPYLKKNWGFSSNFLYSENRETAYKTTNNKLDFFKYPDESKVFFQHRGSISIQHRYSPLLFQKLTLQFQSSKVDSQISTELNPSYFSNAANRFKYFFLEYNLVYDKTIYPLYPLGKYKIVFNLRKDGLGIFDDINNSNVSLSLENHYTIKNTVTFSNKIKYSSYLQNEKIPYYLNRAIGYGSDKITGYQLYVIDGKTFYLSKNAVKFWLLDRDITFKSYMPSAFKLMNTKIFLRANFDLGYVSDPSYGQDNSLTNSLQYGYGPEIDVILYNLVTISCEYGITRFGQKGLFFESIFNF